MQDAIVFTVLAMHFKVCIALDRDNSAEERLTKICDMTRQSRFGIHDLSYTKLDPRTHLPRFNMPFELGLFLGRAHFGNSADSPSSCLILDRDPYRYLKFLSDIRGRDIQAHDGSPSLAIKRVRDWLATESGDAEFPGCAHSIGEYRHFRHALPKLCRQAKRNAKDLTFNDYRQIASAWIRGKT